MNYASSGDIKVGDTVWPLSGGPLMKVEGFEPGNIFGEMDERGLARCVLIHTDDRKDSEKERFTLPRVYLERWEENRTRNPLRVV